MNEIHLQGQIKRVWTYGYNMYARISVRRDPGRPKRTSKNGGPYDYITVMFPDGKDKLNLNPGQFLTVHGWVQSRDFDESLADFVRRVEDADDLNITPEQQRKVVVHRSIIEVVADRWMIQR